MDEHRRRFDRTPEDIDKMILETEDPKDRAFLMILANVADRLIKHEEKEVVMFQEGKRLILIITFFTNVMLGMVVWYGQARLTQIDTLATVQAAHTNQLHRIEERHQMQDRRDGK